MVADNAFHVQLFRKIYLQAEILTAWSNILHIILVINDLGDASQNGSCDFSLLHL